ncbi:MAG: DsbA family protein [Pyrinomonadaceae bacterium]|nr:DsbA family protein [Pyrinomonadaceae bacterium]
MKKYLPFIFIAIVLCVSLEVVALLVRSSSPPPPAADSKAVASQVAPATQSSSAPPPPSTTSSINTAAANVATGSVALEEFGDFQCPPCAVIDPVLKKIKADYGNRLQFTFRHYPLMQMHKHALASSRAAEAARVQGRFWEMHDRLYKEQTAWSNAADAVPIFTGYARGLGMDAERFRRDMDSAEVNQRIALDLQRAHSLKVTGTPTLFINNREVPYEQVTDGGLRQAINAALGEKR